MNRLHVNLGVADLDASVRFYSALFGAAPSVLKADYAKWMLDDPRVNFAISTCRGDGAGIDHLGIQVESRADLDRISARLERAGLQTTELRNVSCCYARQDKAWVRDPQGVRWETFLTHGAEVAESATPDRCCA